MWEVTFRDGLTVSRQFLVAARGQILMTASTRSRLETIQFFTPASLRYSMPSHG